MGQKSELLIVIENKKKISYDDLGCKIEWPFQFPGVHLMLFLKLHTKVTRNGYWESYIKKLREAALAFQ